jgi:hypothetical protein
MTWAAVAIGGSAALGAGMSYLNRPKGVNPSDFYTPQQLAAQTQLSDFARTGTFGDFTAGASVPLGYGDFNPTTQEQTGLSSLQSLLTSGIPDQYKMGDAALKDFMDTSPEGLQKMLDPYKGVAQRQINEGTDAAKRTAGFAGSLYSTDTIKNLGAVQARGNETLTAKLADLTNSALDRKLQAIPLAFQSAQGQEAINMGRIGASQSYGALTRLLNDQQIKARDAELLRRRSELQMPIQAAETIAGQAGRSFPDVSQSPYQQFLGQIGGIAGQWGGNQLYLNQYRRFMGPGQGGTSSAPGVPPPNYADAGAAA